jgi:hypothetical protein
MARRFEEAGLPARALVGGDREREQVLRDFREGRLCALFTVDLLNEGVDIPEIDTVLFLRPTESATVFLQQLGRGLRLCDGKRYLTVLDFIATADRAFRFDLRYRALLGTTRSGLAQQVEAGFPVLPAGCAITLAPDAAQVVLDNLRHALSPRRDRLVAELRSLGADITLAGFLEHANLELPEVYNRRSFTELRREAGFPMPPAGPEEARLSLSIGRLLHVDDPFAIDRLVGALRQDAPQPLDPVVLTTLLDEAVVDPAAAARILWANPAIRHELVELLSLLRVGVAHVPIPLGHPRVPLSLHCRYRLEQVMAAFGAVKDGKLHRPREGVWFDPATGADVFFVTLQKAEKDYSPSTLYEDYALSRDRFHWQTQSATTPTSERGRRNLEHRERGITPLLFVRSQKRDERGDTVPYTFLGPLEIERWQGEKPISIVWRLLHPMPADVFESARVAG